MVEDKGCFQQRWMCEPPELGVQYVVVRSEWDADFITRTIYEIELADVS